MLNQKDMKILSYLRQDSRTTLTYMSKITGIPTSTLFDRVKAQRNRFVKRYTSLLNFERLGFDSWVNILLHVGPDSKERLASFLQNHPGVNSLFKLSNEYDFLVECVFRDDSELESFTKEIKLEFGIMDIEVFPIIHDVKREGFLADPNISERLVLP